MAIDPITAAATVASIGVKMLGMAASGPDPSKVALFETYRMVQAVSDQVEAQGETLVGIHDQIIALRAELGETLVFHDDRRDTVDLLLDLRRIAEHYEAYLFQTLDSSSSPARAAREYAKNLEAEEKDFREKLFRVASEAPLGLDVALDATIFELYLNRRDGDGVLSSAHRARERIATIRSTMERELAPLIEEAGSKVDDERLAAARLMSVRDWFSADEAVVFGASHHAPWLGRAVLTCLRFFAIPHEGEASLSHLKPDARGPASVILRGDLNSAPDEVCSSRLTRDGGLRVEGVAIRTVDSPNLNGRDVLTVLSTREECRVGKSLLAIDVSDYVRATACAFDEANDRIRIAEQDIASRTNDALAALSRVNLATASYAALLNYNDNLDRALADFDMRLRALEASGDLTTLDAAFELEIADIAAIRQGPGDVLREVRNQILELDRDEFRMRVAEASWAADERIAASVARVEDAIARQGSSDVRKVLSTIVVMAEIWSDTVKLGEAISKAESQPDVSEVPVPVREEVEEKPARTPLAAREARPKVHIEAASGEERKRPLAPFDEAAVLARELLALPPPSAQPGDPSTMPLTPHEDIAGRLLPLLQIWSGSDADAFVATYGGAREDLGETLVNAAAAADVGRFAKALLAGIVSPEITGAGADADSIVHRDAIMRSIEPTLREMVRWRLGEASQ